MKAPKQLKVTPKLWSAVKDDLKSKNYKKQADLIFRHGISISTITNISESDSYLDYLKKYAPTAVKWYKSSKKTNPLDSLSEIERITIENMAENFALKVVNRRMMSDLILYKLSTWFLLTFVLVSFLLKIIDMFLA